MIKKFILYHCPSCKKIYQLSEGVEVVNKFAWSRWEKERDRVCKGCSGEED